MTDDEQVAKVKELLANKNGSHILEAIISGTLCRFKGMSEDEIKAELDMADSNKSEKDIITNAIVNIMMERCAIKIKMHNGLQNHIKTLTKIKERREANGRK